MNFTLQKKLKKLTKEEVSKFLEGDSVSGDPSLDPESNLPFSIPYDRNFEIDLKDVDIDRNALLGSGAYGLVFKGKLLQNNLPIAIKTLKPNADILYFRSLLSELKVMTFIGEHENIVRCIGASTSELKSSKILDIFCTIKLTPFTSFICIQIGKLYIIVEFCALGSMESYLRDHRDDFKHLNQNRPISDCEYQNFKIASDPGLLSPEEIQEKRISNSKYVNLSRNSGCKEKLGVVDLIRWGYEISNAMEYLCTKKVKYLCGNIHLD